MNFPPPTCGLERGERAPDFVLPRADGTSTRFYGTAGGAPTLLVFHDPEAHSDPCSLLKTQTPGPLDLAVVVGAAPAQDPDPAVTRFIDADGKVRQSYRLEEKGSFVVVLSPNLRTLAVFLIEELESTAARIAEVLCVEPPATSPKLIVNQAPVLLVDDVLPPELCKELIFTPSRVVS